MVARDTGPMSELVLGQLDSLPRQILEMVGMAADEAKLGVDGDLRALDDWSERLLQAVEDGLDAAYQRAHDAHRAQEADA